MIAIILAIAIQTTTCTMTGEDKSGVLLTCDDAARSELRIPIGEWPAVWHGPELGFAYRVVDGQPIVSKPSLTAARAAHEQQVREGRRWRRAALQQKQGIF